MSNGILQKVFKKYYTGGFEVDIDDNTINVIPQRTLEDFAKELIEEIKKASYYDNSTYDIRIAVNDLIGDNE